MALSTADIVSKAQEALTKTTELQAYFNNFLTVQTFAGDYMFQRLGTLAQTLNLVITDASGATPNTADITKQIGLAQTAANDLMDYDTRFLTVQTFGGDYLTERLIDIQARVNEIAAG